MPYHHTPPNLQRHAYPGPDPCQEHVESVDPNQCWPYNNIVIEKVNFFYDSTGDGHRNCNGEELLMRGAAAAEDI